MLCNDFWRDGRQDSNYKEVREPDAELRLWIPSFSRKLANLEFFGAASSELLLQK